jgi:adenine specific DNA methylase Mod
MNLNITDIFKTKRRFQKEDGSIIVLDCYSYEKSKLWDLLTDGINYIYMINSRSITPKDFTGYDSKVFEFLSKEARKFFNSGRSEISQ